MPSLLVCLIDVHLLVHKPGYKQKTLKDVFQDAKNSKVFFDACKDSDALFTHLDVALQGVEDVELMKSSTRTTRISRKRLSSLTKSIEKCGLAESGLASWKLAKKKGNQLFKPKIGSFHEVFAQRPMTKEIISYFVVLVYEETKKRQKPEYQPHAPNTTPDPWSADQDKILNN